MSAQSFEPPAAATGKQSTQITTIRVTNAASARSDARAIGLPCTEKTKRRGVRRSLCGADSGVGIGLPSCDEPERRTRRLSPRHRWRRGRLPPPMSLIHIYAADEEDSVDLGGRRIIKKKKK